VPLSVGVPVGVRVAVGVGVFVAVFVGVLVATWARKRVGRAKNKPEHKTIWAKRRGKLITGFPFQKVSILTASEGKNFKNRG
jgi:hypothetical protein